MTIILENKHTLKIKEFVFKCCIGKGGLSNKKTEGDKKTPLGTFGIEKLYFRKDRVKEPQTSLKCIEIIKNMGWCDDMNFPKKYNKLIKVGEYDLLIPIKYNFKSPVVGLGSCIFIHVTRNYKPTAGCIALSKKDFLIILKLINKKTKIKIL